MEDPDIKKLYKFSADSDAKKKRNLIIVTVVTLSLIAGIFVYQFISGFFPNQNSRITQVINDPKNEEDELQKALLERELLYRDAGIPYFDPGGRYSIEFATPVPSSSILVGIYVQDKDGSVKKEVDERIRVASTYVEISAITYLNNSGSN